MFKVKRLIKYYLSYTGIVSFFKLTKIRNKYRGEKCIIVCNGPSLNDIDFSCLGNTHCFGLNKINLLDEDKFKFISDIIAVNQLVIQQNKDFYTDSNNTIYLDAFNAKHILPFNKTHIHLCTIDKKFSTDPRVGISQGGTVTFVAIQLAYYMGFSKVGLIGCDHEYDFIGTPHSVLEGGNADINHFHKNYFANNTWNAPDLKMSEESYKYALKAFDQSNKLLVNCSTKTQLNTIPKMGLEKFLDL